MKGKLNKRTGITLIALVLTIIVLLILTGVSIATLTGENGILTRASKAGDANRAGTLQEQVDLWLLNQKTDEYAGNSNSSQSLEELVEDLVEQKLLTENEKDEILGNAEKGIEASYQIKVGEETVKFANDNWDGEKKVNAPVLKAGMTPVYWNADGTEVKQGDEGFDESKWYEYKAGDNATDSQDSKWANAMTEDGSYWVWIPRYEYKLTAKTGEEEAGKIEVKFIPTTVIEADTDEYLVHPAFKNGSNNHYMNGEWDSEISGIWVAKYEMSMETYDETSKKWNKKELSVEKTIDDSAQGDVPISSTIRAVSKPGVSSWRWISIGKMYDNSYNYDRSKESHLMKNSEWGAVAYLTHSQYGRNGTEITMNNSTEFYTGGGIAVADLITTNKAQSTTGNESGIYDINGGTWERLAGYITNGNANLKNYATTTASLPLVATFSKELNGYKSLSTKYSTVYPFEESDNDASKNWEIYNTVKEIGTYGYGDAILENSTAGAGATGWFGNCSDFVREGSPFFKRGGDYSNEGIAGNFAFSNTNGSPQYNMSFRTVVVCE